MTKPTIASVVKKVAKRKPVNVDKMVQDINKQYPELGMTKKELNNFLYSEYYGEDYERCVNIKNFY
jgi:hypothetical protein